MPKREWGAESNGKLSHLFIPSKTATLVPEFTVEDLPLGRTATLVPELAVKTPFRQNTMIMMICVCVCVVCEMKVEFLLVKPFTMKYILQQKGGRRIS